MSSGVELYLIRHAETVMNTTPHLVGGRSNETPLSPRGPQQAKSLGRFMLAEGIVPVGAIATPALRTQETARLSLTEMGLSLEPVICEELIELSQGIWEGRPRADAYTPEVLSEIERLGMDFKLEGGESMNEVGSRVDTWVNARFPLSSDIEFKSPYVVYAHGGSIKYWLARILSWDHKQTFETPIDNCSVSLVVGENEKWTVKYINKSTEAY